MSKNGKARGSVAREIEGVEQKLAACRRHLENVDFKLRKQELSEEGRYQEADLSLNAGGAHTHTHTLRLSTKIFGERKRHSAEQSLQL
ncbi:coiled-coil domain-containing protein 167 isoform X2 [Rhinatrema bivittatum]|uniref:coiled-coil domain-containing protein 167 isoform X2 n=1 Tax=Rhinatrema bivittatum TaxID=194408 RepID=UPI00112942C1|nr:coiled-coil domain-containing protein 167 isoform X2 [Rhinatrema bivittatum]